MDLDRQEFRSALGTFATGVCVITAMSENDEPFGMTVNSFSSVSLDPALVLWSLQNDSDCFPAFELAEKYAVNVLAADQQDLSTLYAQKGNHDLQPQHYQMGEYGLPIIAGAVSSFECSVWARYAGGDHTIIIGEVKFIDSDSSKQPLLFNAGQYRELR
ncbi:MAG: flavin reductase family protein [Oceanicoccus sp.]